MADRSKNGTQYNNHKRVTELHNGPAHAHTVAAERHDKQAHETPHEQTRKAQEHQSESFLHGHETHGKVEEAAPSPEQIAVLAYELWQARGCPQGSADEDWLHATQQLQARK